MRHDPTFWILARAAGLTAYLALTASMLVGLTLKTRLLGKAVRPAAITDVHKVLALTGLGALALHGLALVLDSTVEISPLGLLVPGLVDYRTGWIALGVVGGELMVVVTASFWLRKRIGTRVWRSLHWLSFVACVLAAAHGVAAGSDSDRPWAVALYATTLGAVAGATAWRALRAPTRSGRGGSARRAAPPAAPSGA